MEQKLQQKYEMEEHQLKQEYEDKMRFVYTKVMVIYSSQYNVVTSILLMSNRN